MIQRSNPRVIGGFVLGGIALLVTAILVFGSGQLFRKYEKAVIFFKGSVGGLRVGAPVDFRGVQIGSVQDISIQYDVQTGSFSIPVVVDIDPSRVKGVSRNDAQRVFTMQTLIERGLRAELRLQSFVTGQMDVQLDFHPDSSAQTVGSDLPYPEIPAIASTFEQAQEMLTDLGKQAPEMIKRLNLVLDRAGNLLSELSDGVGTARVALVDLAKFSKALGDSDEHIRNTLVTIDKLATDLDHTAQHADAMTLEFGDAGKRLNRILADNDGTIKTMLAQASKAATGLGQLSEQLNHLVAENRDGLKDFTSSGLYDLTNLIRDTQDMVGNLNRTIDELRRNPSQFLFGQQQREVPANRGKTP